MNERARQALSAGLGPEVWVVGEIHGLKVHAKSGHVYFDLVEKALSAAEQYIAKVSCAFFRGSFVSWRRSLTSSGFTDFELASGIEVKLKAKVDLFIKEGRYQLIVSEIDPSYTLGAIARRRVQTIEKLKAAGLMERNKSLALSMIPLNIGLITSMGSAAYQDFTSIIIKSRYAFRIKLFDAHMQGENTIAEVTQGIKALEKDQALDAIVIIRGGGAKTDLFVFDDITICRSIALCTKPVITGIGHEIDLSVADMTAHTHHVTPTDTARFLVSRLDGVFQCLMDASLALKTYSERIMNASAKRPGILATRLALLTRGQTSQAQASLSSSISALFRKASSLLGSYQRHLIHLASDIARRFIGAIHMHESIISQRSLSLRITSPGSVAASRHDIERRHGLMLKDLSLGISQCLKNLNRYERELDLLMPEHTLKRGYTITLGPGGKSLHDSQEVKEQDHIESVLMKGKIHSIVWGKEP